MTNTLPIAELKGLSGGRKSLWLRVHHDEIVAYRAENGDKATMLHYGIKYKRTLLNNIEPLQTIPEKLTKADRAIAMAEMAIESGRQTRKEVKELQESYNNFVPYLAKTITAEFVKFIGQMPLPSVLEYNPVDPLSLTDWKVSGEK